MIPLVTPTRIQCAALALALIGLTVGGVGGSAGPWRGAPPSGDASAQGDETPPGGDAPAETAAHGGATGRASVRLVRLLSVVPDQVQESSGPLHDLRVRLLQGNVVVFRQGGEFSALLPIDRLEGRPDSLRYFYYVEKAPFLWFFPGDRSKGIRTVAEGGTFQFNAFRLLWGAGSGADGTGWIYFPEVPENHHLRFSVVSGQSVDRADPKDTEYWIELGAEERAGF